jgi:hypothetical protein
MCFIIPRDLRENEKHGETYWYSFLWNTKSGKWYKKKNVVYEQTDAKAKLCKIKQKAINDHECFERFKVGKDLQGINYSVLGRELQENDVVLLEISYKQVDKVMKFCEEENKKEKENKITVKRIFVSPLSDDDYEFLGCSSDNIRDIITTTTMFCKLMSRATEDIDKIKERAKRAVEEMKMAKELSKNNQIQILVNHFGEGVKEWDELQKRVRVNSQCSDFEKKYFSSKKEIDKTFRQFLEMTFPEIIWTY